MLKGSKWHDVCAGPIYVRIWKLSKILLAFQYCYLGDDRANNYFTALLNLEDGDYSRYLFFYLNNIIEKEDYDSAKEISSTIELLSSSLLISQAKIWIENSDFKKFKKYFSCKEENDILSE